MQVRITINHKLQELNLLLKSRQNDILYTIRYVMYVKRVTLSYPKNIHMIVKINLVI